MLTSRQNQWVTVAGVVLVRQKPGTAKGVVFITLEDETGTVNLVIWKKMMVKFRRTVMSARLIAVRGRVQREGDVIHVVAHDLIDRTADLDTLSYDKFELQFANADHVKSPLPETSPMKRKVDRLEAKGETAEGDVGLVGDHAPDTARRNPGVSNANIIPLSRADEVMNPQVERNGWQLDAPNAKLYRTRTKSADGPNSKRALGSMKPAVIRQGRHSRNATINPKSRDFH